MDGLRRGTDTYGSLYGMAMPQDGRPLNSFASALMSSAFSRSTSRQPILFLDTSMPAVDAWRQLWAGC